jgi:hypothetical protein
MKVAPNLKQNMLKDRHFLRDFQRAQANIGPAFNIDRGFKWLCLW